MYTLYVTGCVLSIVVAEPFVQPLNHSVILLKESDIFLTSDTWCIALDFNLSMYYEIISNVKADIFSVEQHKPEFTSVSEFRQIETQLQIVESKLNDFYQFLPRLDHQCSILGIVGTILKTLFGTATLTDLDKLRNTLDELEDKNSDIVHSLFKHVTYVKKLDTVIGINFQAIANLTSVIKNNLIHSHESFQNITKDIAWLHFMTKGQSALFSAIRQTEFSSLQLTQQLDDLFDAVQCAIHGKLPIKLVKPTLQNILRNVTLHLPEGYELIVGTRTENVHIYYKLAKVSLVANARSIKLIVSVLLKTTNSHSDLYRIVILPQRITSNKHVRYSVDYPYFAIQHSKHDYLLFTKTDYSRCYRGSVTICPSNVSIFSAQTKTCEMSLYFQTSAAYSLCRRQLIYDPQVPVFQKSGTLWIYYFSTPHPVTLQC
jgi:hypothetical protein